MREVREEILSEFSSNIGVLLPVDWVICLELDSLLASWIEEVIVGPVMVAIRSVIQGGTRDDA